MIQVHNKNLSITKILKEVRDFSVIAHVTARDMHNMPKKEFYGSTIWKNNRLRNNKKGGSTPKHDEPPENKRVLFFFILIIHYPFC
jgi:hypothetical protein